MQDQEGSAQPQQQNEAASHRKKRPAHGDIASLSAAWAKSWPQNHTYRIVGEELTQHAGQLKACQLTAIIPAAMVTRWRQKYAATTAWTRRAALKNLLRWLHENGAPKIEPPKMRKPGARTVTASGEQITRLLTDAKPHMRLFLLLCWQTALRFAEARAVTPECWDRKNQTITMQVKGGGKRCIPTTPEIEDLLRVAAASGDAKTSCIELLHGGPLSYHGLREAWRRLKKKAQVDTINPHDLRRTTATAIYAITKDLRAAQQYLGHSNMTSTLHYLAPLKEEQLRQYQQLLNFRSEVKQ